MDKKIYSIEQSKNLKYNYIHDEHVTAIMLLTFFVVARNANFGWNLKQKEFVKECMIKWAKSFGYNTEIDQWENIN